MRYSCIFVLCLLLSPIAAPRVRADNSPERALRDFKTYVLPKISYACASDFSAEYDGESAIEHYVDDVLQKAKRWDESGKLVVDEEYEADGSRKSRRM